MTVPQGLAYDPHPTRPTWTCTWCAAPLANDVIQHRDTCTWVTRLAPAHATEALMRHLEDLQRINEKLRHDLLDAQTARQMAEAERDQAAAQLHEVRHIQRTLTPVEYQ